MSTVDPQSRRAESEDARDLMLTAAAVFVRWERRFEELMESLPDVEYAEGTGDPLTVNAAVQGLLEATVYDEIQPAVELLRRAAAWLDDPESWSPPQPN